MHYTNSKNISIWVVILIFFSIRISKAAEVPEQTEEKLLNYQYACKNLKRLTNCRISTKIKNNCINILIFYFL